MTITVLLLGLLLSTQQQAFGQPEVARVAFTRPAGYPNHVEIQPQGDHHRVRVFVHFKDMAGKQGFARMTYDDAANVENMDLHPRPRGVSVHRCDIADASEVWVFYFRVPRFNQDNMTYQIDVGEFIPDDPMRVYDGYGTQIGFRYSINRNPQGEASFDPLLGQVEQLFPIDWRIAMSVGGTIEIQTLTRVSTVSLQYGVSGSHPALPGRWVARRIDR